MYIKNNFSEHDQKTFRQQISTIQKKIKCAQKIYEIYQQEDIYMSDFFQIKRYTDDIQNFMIKMQIQLLQSENEQDRQKMLMIYIMKNDIIGKLSQIEEYINYIYQQTQNADIHDYYQQYKQFSLNIVPLAIEFRQCCGLKMKISPKTSELSCLTCGKSKKYKELQFEKVNSTANGEIGKNRINKYNPMKNFNKWLLKLTCKDDCNISKKNLEKIVNKYKRDIQDFEIGKFNISTKSIRECLKQLGLQQYNTQIAYVKYYLTGKSPPQFTDNEVQTISDIYSKIINIYQVRSVNYNITYCPHFILKIIENLFSDQPEKLEIRYYIHFQKMNTVWKFNDLWKQICNTIPELKYSPVDSDLYM